MLRIACAMLILTILPFLGLDAGEPVTPDPGATWTIERASGPIVIDGQPGDKAWRAVVTDELKP